MRVYQKVKTNTQGESTLKRTLLRPVETKSHTGKSPHSSKEGRPLDGPV